MDVPPSAYALSRRPWVKFVLVLQSLLCAARAVLFLDIMGAYGMIFMLAFGYLGIRENIHLLELCLWGVMCFVVGSGDIASIMHLVINGLPQPPPPPSTKTYILAGIRLATIAVTLLGVPLAWWLFKDSGFANIAGAQLGPGDRSSERRRRRHRDHSGYTEQSALIESGMTVPFTPFTGQARRL